MKTIVSTILGFVFVMSAGHTAGEQVNHYFDTHLWSHMTTSTN